MRRSATCACLALLAPSPASPQATYPNRPIRFVVTFAPGGNADTVARVSGQKVAESLGQQVVVDNRSGANGNIGMEIVARAAADGYSIVLGYISNVAIAPSLMANLPYDPVKDFAPISLLASAQNIVVVHPAVPAYTLKELIELSKARPKSVNFSTAGVGTIGHLTGEFFNTSFSADFQHVPYRGGGQGVVDLLSGQIQMTISGMSSVMPHIKAGRLRAIAVTGAHRASTAPEVPAVAEALMPGFEATAWYGALAPIRTPRAVVRHLSDEFAKAMAAPDIKQRLEPLGFDVVGSTPETFAAYIKSETVKWAKVVKASGAKVQ
jgi:tripartite-type tricarboxylate transporter receptor subunit TctC